MGKSNQQRRVEKRKARAATAQPAADRPSSTAGPAAAEQTGPAVADPSPAPSIAGQAAALVQAAADSAGNPDALDDAVRDLVVFAGTTGSDQPDLPATLVTARLMDRVGTLYEHGWQPADVLHRTRSDLGNRFVGPVAALVLQQALTQRAPDRAPQEWVDQLAVLTDEPLAGQLPRPSWSVAAEWGRVNAWDLWHDLATLIRFFADRRPMQRIVPPPSSWPLRRAPAWAPRADPAAAPHDERKLATIRALLAKAEATEFLEEADAFTTKAQDLMTRYAIDEALLAHTDDVRTSRVHIDNPYATAKAQLLATVGQVNRVKAIWDEEHGIATVVGLPVDLELAELLFTSLLVQATRAMTEAGAVTSGGHRLDRSPSFRRAFLLSYADRIGERLVHAGRRAEQEETERRGSELLPVLARQSAAVEREFARLFPDTRQSRATRVDARGWEAGRAAADRAVLARGQVGPRPA